MLSNLIKIFFYIFMHPLLGTIPSTFGNLNVTLRNLYLKENKLTGTIPSSLGNLYGLTRMGLVRSHERTYVLTCIMFIILFLTVYYLMEFK